MRIKDRLNLITEIDKKTIDTLNANLIINDEPDIFNIFERDSYSEKIISSLINQNKNIIVVSDVNIEKEFPVQYIKKFIDSSEAVEILYDLHKELSYIIASKILVPEVKVVELVKILEHIIYGYKSFIVGFSLDSNENFIEKLKLLIALNFRNLSEENIKTLISSSNLAVVFISKNDDGLFFIKEIAEINNADDKLTMKSSYEFIHLEKEHTMSSSFSDESNEYESSSVEDEVAEVKTTELEESSGNISTPELVEYSLGRIKNILADDESEMYADKPLEINEKSASDEIVVESDSNSEDNLIEEDVIVEAESKEDEKNQIVEISEEKVKSNKYKLLKDKIKMKKFNL